MTIDEFKAAAGYVEKLKAHGATIVEALKAYIKPELKEIQLKSIGDYSLTLFFNGCRVIIRIEIPWQEKEVRPRGQILAYRVTYDPTPIEKLLKLEFAHSFDSLGNIHVEDEGRRVQAVTAEEMPPGYLSTVFTSLASEGINLRP